MYRVLAITALTLVAGCERPHDVPTAPTSPKVPSQQRDNPKSQPSSDAATPLPQAVVDPRDVVWDMASLVTGDFDGDGHADQATLGHVKGGVVVLIEHSSVSGSFNKQLLPFGLNGSEQAATCGPVSRIEVSPLSCSMETEEDTVSGCRESPRAVGLSVGGDCDAIHLYWNHDQGQMAWWRY
jgi:hypothetical protein